MKKELAERNIRGSEIFVSTSLVYQQRNGCIALKIEKVIVNSHGDYQRLRLGMISEEEEEEA